MCSMCGGSLVLLGVLGMMIYYRCRYCGIQVSKEQELSNEDIELMAEADDPYCYGSRN